jgi:hypothetical protein
MGLREDFIAQAKRENWTFKLKKSSLGPLVQTLSVSGLDTNAIGKELAKLSDKKRKKYKNALSWLFQKLPPLPAVVSSHKDGLGLTDQTYAPGKQVRRKDTDDRWYIFDLQQKGNSCGPTCVRIVLKEFTHIQLPSEAEIRRDMGLIETGQANQGITVSNHNWENVGSNVPSITKLLVSKGVKDARVAVGPGNIVLDALKKCTKNYPGIVGWWWGNRGDSSNGGHWTVCVGKNKAGDKIVLLDPWNGVQYLDVATFSDYTVDGAHGWFDPNDPTDPAVVVTFPKSS